MTWIRFEGDGESDLADPSFFIRTNETVNVTLLIGKTYRVLATNEIGVVSIGDPGITVVTNAPGDLTIVRPVTVLVAPRYNLMLLGAGPAESDGSFRMQVSPAVGGTFEWTNTCCTITSRGDSFWFACGGECSCSGCYASGWLVYEGYALPCLGGFCGCPHEDDEPRTEEDDLAHAAGVELSFSKRAVIFEDAYTNAPGEVVARRSTMTTLSCTAHGGPRGARLSLSLAGAEKLVAISGPSLPSSAIFIPPGQKLDFEIEYEGLHPSGTVDDIVAAATLIEEETNARFTVSNTVTSISLEIEPIVERPGVQKRHLMGVREEFCVRIVPEISKSINCSSDWKRIGNANVCCPIRASSESIRVLVRGVAYVPLIDVVEPVGIVCSSGFNRSEDGCVAMELEPYIAPLGVCFSGIRVMEVPTMEIGPSGYFTNSVFSSVWYHTVQRGAGTWYRPGRDNFFFNDIPSFAEYCPPPIDDGSIDWLIPIAWGEDDSEDVSDVEGIIDAAYHQVFTIDEQGGLRIDKFGQWIFCSAGGEISHSTGIR